MEIKKIIVFSREDFRNWLQKHHKTETKVQIIIHKKHTGKPSPSHREQIEEALCLGWIDTTLKRLDQNTYMRNFSKRNQNSRWSSNTLSYARQLIKQGKMTEEGLKYYKLGLQKLPHDHDIPKNPDIPESLKKALEKNKQAKENFNKYPPSTKRMLYRWFLHVKLPETQKKRISSIIKNAEEGKKEIW